MIKIKMPKKNYIGLNSEIEKKINLAKGTKKIKRMRSKSIKKIKYFFLLNGEIERKNRFNKKKKKNENQIDKNNIP
jgi:hypothetical protein